MPTKKLLSNEESKCEQLFVDEHKRTNDGRFEVPLPFCEDPIQLGDSKASAFKRLRNMERRFEKSPKLFAEYTKFMDEYLTLGHMSPLPENKSEKRTYLPHHAVFKESSTTTKLRVVYDASSATTSGKSLNNVLMVGPTIQPELIEILLRFRQYPYVLTGDIAKMYRQVMIKPDHRRHQCILWRAKVDDPPTTYRLNTVTYGVSSAPFLAIRALQQLGYDAEVTYPRAATVITQDFYVDDMITGESTVQNLKQTKHDVTQILKSAGFELTKFHSNVFLGEETCAENYELSDTRVLGLLWQPNQDLLRYEAGNDSTPEVITKRVILSLITQIFDPLGFVGPIIIKAKILLQSLWQLKIDWDSPIPESLRLLWSSYYQQLHLINRIVIPRHAIIDKPTDIQLHGFCDASQTAYGACIYVRSTNNTGIVNVQLLTAKSRVAPLKCISLPRLELCGALLLTQLLERVLHAFTCVISSCYLWSDSEIVLAWIAGEPCQWQTFVGNRTAETQRLTNKDDWSHVRSEDNPADIISRGTLPEQLLESALWWEGPQWLKRDSTHWPKDISQPLIELPEARTQVLTFHQVQNSHDLFSRYSSWNKLQRVVACCLRFKINCELAMTKSLKSCEPLSVQELQRARIILIKLHQRDEFSSELHDLQRGKPVHFRSKIFSLTPFLDSDGVLRVGGRLRNSVLTYSQKHPILLSSKGLLTNLIIREQHLSNFHIGPQLLLTMLREVYWIIQARSTIKRVLGKCILCFRMKPHSPVQLMGDLPAIRVTPSRAFNHTGVDYAGPFNIKISRNKSGKAYLCLFVCMATKAVHLEIVSDLTTEIFLNTLKRFISRRGKCETISSDNGKNFLGASNMLRQVGEFLSKGENQNEIVKYATNQGISWKFIPPHSPHMGGLWEANVKAVKTHLKAVINDTLLSFEELLTVTTQIEAILNSRPLCSLSSDPNDLEVLTPGHFLVGTALLALPDASVIDIPINRLNRYQLLAQFQQSFWKRWSQDYLTQFQQRAKWRKLTSNNEIQIGRLVLIRDENLPPLKWRTGRIYELHPGTDGLTRVVSLKTSNGLIQRSLPKICILLTE